MKRMFLSSILAVSDTAAFLMWGVNLLATIGLGIVLAIVARATNRLQRSEDKREQDVRSLQSSLHSTAEKLIDERFRHMTHQLNGHVQAFTLNLDKMAIRIADAEKLYTRLTAIEPTSDAKLANAMSDLKDYVRELIDERCEKTDTKLDQLAQRVVTDEDLRRVMEGLRRA